ncbi:hypothetical protein E4U43_006393 [Claviceps pusilla]|uniref:non-specific serine/threonine protein kinase n=1 Tax=Claviceps pusilla TaxID=123648 RepID=A0A9P7T2B1_9HYPO|nr:hypothetical protein E4U43_006393 [Claviceps pusilla]
MAALMPQWSSASVTRQKAFEDAKKMQKAVVEACSKSGKEIPRYQLSELIGKGNFGRVYKATSQTTGQLVAVKIIDIEEGDTADPKLADTYSDLLKEINALQLLSESGAKNINHVIEALPVGQSMWMITEYCAGGSVATLMRPTAPGGLQEKWIIPIVREVAEALRWVHGQGIIHRDIKCANVLVTEVGNVQLCDFGVSGVIETKFDKRTTCIGTPHWMAPELFDQSTLYGTEVDIWAFGALVYEVASGLPPNVAERIDFSRLGSRLKQHTPRLEGDCYSHGLKDLAAYCLQHEASKRPTIEEIQKHRYIFNTEETFPTASLAHLVRAFKLWEAQGGHRHSLFSMGGAQGLSSPTSNTMENDDWNFSTTDAFDQQVFNDGEVQDVYDVYGTDVDFSKEAYEETSKPPKGKSRRRPPPHLPSVKAPLEKVFDRNTISNYEDNSRSYYGRFFPAPVSDLPLRDESAASADVRESLIDLDASLDGSDLSQFVDLGTIRAGDSRASMDYDMGDTSYNNTPSSDPVDMRRSVSNNRRTQDWKFPTIPQLPASANPEVFTFPSQTIDAPAPAPAPVSSSARPALIHHPTDPYQTSKAFDDLAPFSSDSVDHRASVDSLIDLDMSFADSGADYTRPSTSHSDVGSINGSEVGGTANPFELEKHASLYAMPTTIREPSIYVSDGAEFSNAFAALPMAPDAPDASDAPNMPSDNEQTPHEDSSNLTTRNQEDKEYTTARPYSLSEFADMDPEDVTPQPTAVPSNATFPSLHQDHSDSRPSSRSEFFPPPRNKSAERYQYQQDDILPPMPDAPSPRVMQGQASADEVKQELRRLAMSLRDHLSHANAYMSNLTIRRASVTRLDAIGDGDGD